MIMDIKEYKNKVRGCWLGKNIGGTLGSPFEGKRGVMDLNFYTQDLKDGALPNDDLDLQLVWLNAAERYGKSIDSKILSEYWISCISANWSEYGAGKNNLSMGIMPPISGWYNNHNRDSCGAFIRSEIWACLAPGHPEIAVKYAFEDATVDHANEGVYAEIFCAAVQSAAFCETNIDKLIDIGLSYIPNDSGVYLAVTTAEECYKNGLSWKEARKKVLQTTPGSFGMAIGYQGMEAEEDVPFGTLGYDAPSNIGIIIIGWLYGDGDFGKSVCIATGCLEDSDCTAATLGAILGIVHGADNLPEKWTKPIGDNIKVVSLDLSSEIVIPETVTDLTKRVCALMPVFMGKYCDVMNDGGVEIFLYETDELYDVGERVNSVKTRYSKDMLKTQPYGVIMKNILFNATLNCLNGINIDEGKPLDFSLEIENNLERCSQWLNLRWFIPDAWSVSTGKEFVVNLDKYQAGYGQVEVGFSLTPREIKKSKYQVVLEIGSEGRISKMYIPIILLCNPQNLK